MHQSSGHIAEQRAAEYLIKQGYKIVDVNWKTKYCEIDIVAQKHKKIYLVEVKYRQNADFGIGLEYITPKKLKQMEFAAKMWVSDQNWNGDYQLSAISLHGDDYETDNFIDNVLC